MAVTQRLVKGTALTWAEADANLTGLASGANWNTVVSATASLTLTDAFTRSKADGVQATLAGAPVGFFLQNTTGPSGSYSPVILFDIQGGGGGARIGTSRLGGAGGILHFGTDTTGAVMTDRFVIDEKGLIYAPNNLQEILVGTSTALGVAGYSGFRANGSTGGFFDCISNGTRIGTMYSETSPDLRLVIQGNNTPISIRNTADQIRIPVIAATVNYLVLHGRATGGNPVVAANGSDSNVNLAIVAKAAGAINIFTGGAFTSDVISSAVQQVTIPHVASAVNYLSLYGRATGGNPIITVNGTDTNVGLGIAAKGSSPIQFYTNSAFTGDVASSADEQFRIANTSSAVNFIQVTGGATGLTTTLSAQGETNVTLTISPKGSGNLILNPNTGDIRWNKALVALGGGAAPTFGTIGGTGPATAAQNSWMRVLDSAGAAFWVPVWK